MPAKTPIYLKSTNSKKGKKCRLRDILSPDMISPPLGDFRHTIHIGKGGERDAFGDMSFLQGKFELLGGKGGGVVRPQYGTHNEFLRANSASEASFAETPSPVLKNAISLPSIGGCQALTLPHISTAMFTLPPDPLDGVVGTTSMGPDRADELEILQMDALLRSMEVFSSEHNPPATVLPSKPDVLLDLVEQPDKRTTKTVSKSNKMHNGEHWFEKPSSHLFKGNVICNGNRSFNGNGNCNGYGNFNSDVTIRYEKELFDCNGDWVDRDSGVDEGRICDFDFQFSKEKSTSQERLSQITGSLLSLELDLGPSILDDVLNIMDKPKARGRP